MHSSSLGESIKRLRDRKKLSQVDLAKAADCDPSTISRLERGEADNPTLDLIAKIAASLGVTAGQLIDGGHDSSAA